MMPKQSLKGKTPSVSAQIDMQMMASALLEADQAQAEGEIPVGAVVVCEGEIIASAHNRREQWQDPTAHAEVLALREAAKRLGRRRLSHCALYVTLEPCAMCAGAALASGVERVIFGAYDERQGCTGSVYALPEDPSLGHIPCVGGVLQKEAEQRLDVFFKGKRKKLSHEDCALGE